MKKLSMLLMFVLPMVMASHHALAQEVTITLYPGWNWISYPRADTLDIATGLGSITPTDGDMIKFQAGFTTYMYGTWYGSVSQFVPGKGLMYKSMNPNTINFVFGENSIPSVTTLEVSDIGQTTATGSGDVVASGGETVTERGICWSTSHNPTTSGSHANNGTGTGTFTINMTGLTANTTYYVRAYATNSKGTAYGNEVSFTTLGGGGSGNVPEGAINGLFTINANGDQVYFSQGNLQYQASTNTWRFAENQWDFVGGTQSNGGGSYSNFGNVSGSTNNLISSTYAGWIDLFGWGTSGYNHGANCYQPWSTSQVYSDYYTYGIWNSNLYDQNGTADWGYNPISNGGNEENVWRTLTQPEWDYVMNTRNTVSGIRFVKAKVAGVSGIILFPDNWDENCFTIFGINNSSAGFTSNSLTEAIWESIFEANGAVFLPTTGYRISKTWYKYSYSGYYRSASYYNSYDVYSLGFDSSAVSTVFHSDGGYSRYNGFSVRLVFDAE